MVLNNILLHRCKIITWLNASKRVPMESLSTATSDLRYFSATKNNADYSVSSIDEYITMTIDIISSLIYSIHKCV